MKTLLLLISIFVTLDILATDITPSVSPKIWDIECSDSTPEMTEDIGNENQLSISNEFTEEDDANNGNGPLLLPQQSIQLRAFARGSDIQTAHPERVHQPPCF